MGLKELLSNKLAVAAILVAAVLVVLIVLMQPAAKAPVPMCGDSVCSSDESCAACPGDCGVCGPSCGDSVCDAGENCSSCPADCSPCEASYAELMKRWLPGMPCDLFNGANATPAYAYAVENKMLEACSCIGESRTKSNCEASVKDILNYEQAVMRFDPSSCDLITVAEQRDACKAVVASGVSYVGDRDLNFLAEVYMLNQQNTKAIALLLNATAANASDSRAWISMSLAYSSLQLSSGEDHLQQALSAAETALNLSPGDEQAHYAKGFAYETAGRLAEAVATYTEWINKQPDSVMGYTARGHAYNKIGNLTAAIADFQSAVTLGSEDISTHSQLCRLYASLAGYTSSMPPESSNIEKAVEACNKVINLSGYLTSSDQLMGARITMANMYMAAGRIDEAKTQIDLALVALPNSADALIGLARWYVFTNDSRSAQTTAEDLLRIDPMRAAGYSVLAYSLYMQRDYDGVIESALKGLEVIDRDVSLLPPNRPPVKKDLCYMLANAYGAKGDTENALIYAKMGDAILF